MQPLASSCPAKRVSTSSSVIFSPASQRKQNKNCQKNKLNKQKKHFKKRIILPSVVRTWRSSAPITVPFPSLSKTRRPSTMSSNEPWSLFLVMAWNMGRNCSKSSNLFISAREEEENQNKTDKCVNPQATQWRQSKTVVSSTAGSGASRFCVESAGSPCVGVGSVRGLRLPPTLQIH